MMLAIFAGSAAAITFGVSTLCSARSSRSIGAASTVGWVAMIGLAITLPFIVVTSVPRALTISSGGWLLVSGAGNALGLLLAYRGLPLGKVGVVGPILSTEGAVAALLAVAAGQQLGVRRIAALSVIAVGSRTLGHLSLEHRHVEAGSGCRMVGGGQRCAFRSQLYATRPVRALSPPRLGAAPRASSARQRWPTTPRCGAPAAHPAICYTTRLTAAACEVAGFALYTLGARHDIAVTAVLVSLFGAVAAILARRVFEEHLGRVQTAGIATIVAGFSALQPRRAHGRDRTPRVRD